MTANDGLKDEAAKGGLTCAVLGYVLLSAVFSIAVGSVTRPLFGWLTAGACVALACITFGLLALVAALS